MSNTWLLRSLQPATSSTWDCAARIMEHFFSEHYIQGSKLFFYLFFLFLPFFFEISSRYRPILTNDSKFSRSIHYLLIKQDTYMTWASVWYTTVMELISQVTVERENNKKRELSVVISIAVIGGYDYREGYHREDVH